jgi:hypothetical protein
MMRSIRGAALVETALSVSVSLLIVLGAGQMALLGYTQIAADGAAFVASHAAASNPGGNSITTAQSVFKQFSTSNFTTPSPQPNFDPTLVQKSVAGFSLMPGLASSYSVAGKSIEYQANNAGSGATMYLFDANNSYLLNYCAPPGDSCSFPTTYGITLLASTDINMNGNGNNGPFAAWRCHQKIYAKLAQQFTKYSPGNGYTDIQGSDLDVNKNNTDENVVYSWDSGGKC